MWRGSVEEEEEEEEEEDWGYKKMSKKWPLSPSPLVSERRINSYHFMTAVESHYVSSSSSSSSGWTHCEAHTPG